MTERYSRNAGPLTEGEIKLLQEKSVCIVGCGGIGGYAAELLARAGVGRLRVADGDVFDVTNLNRQLLCDENSIGRPKAQTALERIRAINSSITAEAVGSYLTEDNAESIVCGCDAVLDCLDSIGAKRLLAQVCSKMGIPLVHAAVGGWCAQVCVVAPGSNALDIIYPPDSTPRAENTLSFVVSYAASLQAAEAVKLLTGRAKPDENRLLMCDLLAGTEITTD